MPRAPKQMTEASLLRINVFWQRITSQVLEDVLCSGLPEFCTTI
jgi:hypothetical protein